MDLETNVRLDFPRSISFEEVDRMFSYITAQMEEEEGSRIVILTHGCQNKCYGDGHQVRKYEHIWEVPVLTVDAKIKGRALLFKDFEEDSYLSARFVIGGMQNILQMPVFTEIEFETTPGRKLGEYPGESLEVMKIVHRYVKSYFEKTSTR